MKNNYLKKLIKYMKQAYKLEVKLKELYHRRVNPIYSTGEIILPVLLGLYLEFKVPMN